MEVAFLMYCGSLRSWTNDCDADDSRWRQWCISGRVVDVENDEHCSCRGRGDTNDDVNT